MMSTSDDEMKIGIGSDENIAYKVVRSAKDTDVFESCIIQGAHCLKYEVGKKTMPKAGGILCFETLNMARGFLYETTNEVILIVRHGEMMSLPSNRLEWRVGGKAHLSIHAIRRIWNGGLDGHVAIRIGGYEYFVKDNWPDGSIAFEWVNPIGIARW